MSTKGCPDSEVNVYNTIFNTLDYESRGIVKQIILVKDGNKIKMVPIQKQKGTKDCVSFAIAIMTSFTHDKNPSDVTFLNRVLQK